MRAPAPIIPQRLSHGGAPLTLGLAVCEVPPMRGWIVVAGLTACAGVVSPGPGSVGRDAQARLAEERLAAASDAAARACRVAAASSQPRDWRKAAELTSLAVREKAATTADARAWARPVLAKIESDCEARIDGARLLEELEDAGAAGDMLLGAVRQCGNLQAARMAAWPLRKAGRCSDAIGAVRAVWARAPREQWMGLLDAVHACSDPVSLRANLSFVPPEVVDDYFAELRRRAAEERERRRRYAEEERERRAQEAHVHATMDCSSDCSAAVSSCDTSCGGDGACLNRCTALGRACMSGCH
jgi:hypothetical protein